MNGGDNSIVGGILSALTLVAINWFVSWSTYRSRPLSRLIEGRPEVIIHNGHIYRDVMDREKITQAALDSALRSAGCSDVKNVHFAILENNGQISVRLLDVK